MYNIASTKTSQSNHEAMCKPAEVILKVLRFNFFRLVLRCAELWFPMGMTLVKYRVIVPGGITFAEFFLLR